MRWITLFLLALSSTALVACNDYHICAEPKAALVAALPGRLSETGLYDDITAGTLAGDVRPYHPSFPLWSDGAEKRRWISLPDGAEIDTRDPDDWLFPVGTKLWKEFTRDGVRVETRLLHKVGEGEADWAAMAYVWTEAGDDALAAPHGSTNALGTEHDVPASNACMGCHGGRKSRVLGFSLVQLAHDGPPEEWTLHSLVDAAVLSTAPPMNVVVPGEETTRSALGYLHANCGHCHNQQRPETDGPRCYDPENDLDFWLQSKRLAVPSDTPTYHTMRKVVEAGAPADSKLFALVSRRGEGKQMPPLATERVDTEAVATLRAWISGLK
jgi:cytochrome c553